MKALGVIAGVLGVLFIIGCLLLAVIYGIVNDTRKVIVQKEQDLNSQWDSLQSELDAGVTGVREQTNLAFLAEGSNATILREALAGRYGDTGLDTNSALFLAISENYPDVSELMTIWSDIRQYIQDFRTRFKEAQMLMQRMAANYETYLEDDILRSFIIDTFINAPTDNLRAQVGTNVVKGQAALDQMNIVITSSETQDAFNNGTYDGVMPQRPTTTPSER